MSYLVLARKWRPMRFEDLVGQDHVARTLGNAISSGRVAHAFLFTGVRGVGKTTSARILAKALNCMGDPATTPPGPDRGPTVTPCLKCPPCLEITQGTDVDVREIDGASYNGVDEVRKLQDSLPYRPARDRYKIFIVDEVHMLSQSAWNAFLKTLEEPPPHIKFIFATTEVHKVPITILSRVQRFDFKLISTQAIAERLRYVLGEEAIESEESAIRILSREAAGSMRDAMSLLDQVIAWGGKQLTGSDVAQVLGVAPRQVLHEIAQALVKGNAWRCLELATELGNQGCDIPHLARDILGFLRDLVVAKVCENPQELLDLADQESSDLRALAAASDTDDLLRLHQGFSQAFDEVVRSGQPGPALEMLLVRLSRRPPLLPIDHLLERLAQLEQRLGSVTPKRESTPPGTGSPMPPSGGPPPAPAGRPRETRSAEAPRSGRPGDESNEPGGIRTTGVRGPEAVAAGQPHAAEKGGGTEKPSATAMAARPSPEPQPPVPLSPDSDFERFRSFLQHLERTRPELSAMLSHAALLGISPREIALGFARDSVFAQQFADRSTQQTVCAAASEHFGVATQVRFELGSTLTGSQKTLAALDGEAQERRYREALSQAQSHPRIADAVEILGAELKDLRLAQQ